MINRRTILKLPFAALIARYLPTPIKRRVAQFAMPDNVALECLKMLNNNLKLASYIGNEYKQDFQIGKTIKIRMPQKFIITEDKDA